MVLTKKLLLFLCIAFTLGTISTPSLAAKIKNATIAEVEAAMESTVKGAEDILEALNNGVDKETVLKMLSDTKQTHKQIEVTRLGRLKNKASSRMKKARSAVKKDDMVSATAFVTEAVEYYHELRKEYYAF